MLLLHTIIVLGALLASSRARSDPYIIVARPDQEESNDTPRNSENFGVEGRPEEKGDTNVCQSEECRLTAQEFLRNLNQSVDPCEDFYEYACGGWSQHNPIPATERIWNQLKKIQRRNNKHIREILQEPEKDTDTETVKAAKRFHQSCMDLEVIEIVGIRPLEIILAENGGWPMIMEQSEWNSRDVSWMKVQNNYQLLSRHGSIFTVTVDADLDQNFNAIKLNPGDSMMPLKMLIDPEEASNEGSHYAKYVEDVALTFAKSRNSNVSQEQISKDVADIIEFEKSLYKLSSNSRSDDYLFACPIYFLQEVYNEVLDLSGKSKINWLKTFQHLFRDVGIRLRKTDKILVSNFSFVTELVRLLKNTSKRTIVNYLHWKFVSAMMPYTNKKMRNMNYQLNKFIFGVTGKKPRSEKCISENPLKDAVSYQFLHKYLLENSKEKVLDMTKKIQDQFKIHILNFNLMDHDYYPKSQAKQKLWETTRFIGFPDWFNNASANIEFYKDLKVGSLYFYNILESNILSLRNNLGKLRQPIDNTWLVNPFKMNVYRDFIKNSLILPATSHQLPLFGASRPNAVNYGALGTIIGHELSKPFQELERMYLGKECYWDQWDYYKQKETEKFNVSGYEDFNEFYTRAILGNAELQTAYEAYQWMLEAEGITEDKLPGLEHFSGQQLFFLSFANNWCESLKVVKAFDDYLDHEFRVGRYRVIGSVSNTPGFGEAFQCPDGSPMNPYDKCSLWDS